MAAWLADHEAVYHATKAALAEVTPLLAPLKRPYFHVKPLDAIQISAWVKYLDFAEAKGDTEACATVYERCLVPCAAYSGEVEPSDCTEVGFREWVGSWKALCSASVGGP